MLTSPAVKVRVAVSSAALTLIVLGCGQPVREDRTIEFSRDGQQVTFQHGNEGVYVANSNGGTATKIFQPDEKVVATSRPLTSPTDGRILLTTAKRIDDTDPSSSLATVPVPADGRIVSEVPVRFTCWLRNEPVGDQPAEVKELFRATCGHVGYVSAGLAVRWHPDGKHVLFLAALEGDPVKHSVFEFDIESQQTRRVFPQAGIAVLCDWTPNGTALVCAVGENHANIFTEPVVSGIWIGQPGEADSWWRVPESEQLSQGELPSLIERLRASRPSWTRDDSQFAFVSQIASDPQPADDLKKENSKHRLHRVEYASRKLSTITESDGPISDLYWSADGQRLGFITRTTDAPASLRILEPTGAISDVATSQPIRKFAGFDVTSRRLAYVAVSPMIPPLNSTWWALLLLPDPLARDSVWITDANTANSGTEIFSGTRVTFPLWSPTEERLSLWLTFTPQYRSLLSIFRQWGLWPGDPAATIDVRTGEVSWLAVTPQEELQVGHFHLLKHDNAEAWRWYALARSKLPAAKPPQNWTEFTQRVGAPENSQVFEYLCLKRLGRDDEAQAKWQEFERNFFPAIAPQKPDSPAPDIADNFLEAMGPQAELLKHLVHDLYVAEVFLSVDAVDDARSHFRADPPPAADDNAKMSRAIVLAQLLLIAGDRDGYLSHCTDTVLPLAIARWTPSLDQQQESANSVLQFAAGLCLAPLFRSDFYSSVSDRTLQDNLPKWNTQRDHLKHGLPAVAVDLMLRAAALKQDNEIAVKKAEERIASNPAGRELFADKPIDDVIARWFELSRMTLNPMRP